MNRNPYAINAVLCGLVILSLFGCSAARKEVKTAESGESAKLSRNTESDTKEADASKQSLDLASRADAYMKKQEYVQAKALYDRISNDKNLKNAAKVYNNLAICEWKLKNYSAAVAAWEKAVKADASFAEPYAHLGELALKSGDYTRAEQMYRKLVALTPKDLNSNLMWGVALRGKGDLVGAEKAYQRVLSLDGNNAEAIFALAVLYHKFMGRNQEALGYYNRFTELNPEKAKSEKIQQLITQARAEGETSMKTAQKTALSKDSNEGVRQ